MQWLRSVVGYVFRLDRVRGFRRLGRRGLVLLMFGSMWICYGLMVAIVTGQAPRFSGTHAPFPVLSLLDTTWSGLVWIASGLAAVAVGLTRMWRHGRDSLGFNALLAAPFLWLIGYAWSLGLWFISQGFYGRPTAMAGLVIWGTVCAFVILAAGWPDPDDPAFRVRKPEAG